MEKLGDNAGIYENEYQLTRLFCSSNFATLTVDAHEYTQEFAQPAGARPERLTEMSTTRF